MRRLLVACFFSCSSVILWAQPITIGGIVRDSVTLASLDSARIDIVNANNSSERYTVFTNPVGVWSYTFQSSAVDDRAEHPLGFSLAQNYPNPFNPSTTIRFSVAAASVIALRVHNVLGQEIDSKSFSVSVGEHTVTWRSKGAAGALFYTLESNGRRLTKKMIQLDGGGSGGFGNPTLTHGIAALPKNGATRSANYTITASKFAYESDSVTITLANNPNINFFLQTIHRRAFLVDLHNDVLELAVRGYQLGIRHSTNHSDLPRFRDGGVDGQMLSVWPDPNQFPSTAFNRSMQMIDSFSVQVDRNATTFVQTRTSSEIQQAGATGKLAGIIAIEGGHAIENDLGKLVAFYQRGARYMTITWNNSTSWAVSAADSRSATVGLSDFGRQVIRTMDSLGMIIDISHVGRKTVEDILQVTQNPIIASHSGVRALRDHYRNLTDSQIVAIAQRGGVIGVVFYPWFLSANGTATIDSVVRHIEYVKSLAGIDHVALGSDFDGIEVTPAGLEDVSRFPNLTSALLRRGYSNAEVKKILGENYLRVFRAVCD